MDGSAYFKQRDVALHLGPGERIGAPCGITHFPKEAPFPRRTRIERGYDIAHWTEMAERRTLCRHGRTVGAGHGHPDFLPELSLAAGISAALTASPRPHVPAAARVTGPRITGWHRTPSRRAGPTSTWSWTRARTWLQQLMETTTRDSRTSRPRTTRKTFPRKSEHQAGGVTAERRRPRSPLGPRHGHVPEKQPSMRIQVWKGHERTSIH
jgi:hypothetical protein